jgi:hypothetical protein|tara:strand:- start:1 stop:201 length:201 start_codon:yes stop_codon:yes gene_type:complete
MKFFESLRIAGYRFRDSSNVAILSVLVVTVVVNDASVGKDTANDPEIYPSQMARCRMALKVLIKGI